MGTIRTTTRGEIRKGVRYYLGEQIPGTWSDEELNFFIQEACNEHAKRAYSVETVIYTSTIRGVQDYALPPNFGELSSIRYHNETIRDDWGLIYTDKDVIRNWSYGGADVGDSYYYYREQDSFGLFPIPYKPLVLECKFENDCPGFSPIYDRETREEFANTMSLEVEPDATEPIEMEIPDTDLDPRCVWVAEISVYLHRRGTYFPGNLWMSMTNIACEPDEYDFVHLSGPLTAASINSRPEWVHFDFTQNPIEINPTERLYRMQIHTDEEYQSAQPMEYGGEGIRIGRMDDGQAFFLMHRLRHDLEVEYYQNVCDTLEDDDDILQIPDRYAETIRKMVLEKANLKDSYNPQMAAIYKSEADAEIMEAKAQAMIPTLGKRRELRQTPPRLGNLTYNNQTGLFRLRLGG